MVAAFGVLLARPGETYNVRPNERVRDLTFAGIASAYTVSMILAGGMKFGEKFHVVGSVDYNKIMSQLNEADEDIARISEQGARTSEHDLWQRLNRSSLEFSREARRLLSAQL